MAEGPGLTAPFRFDLTEARRDLQALREEAERGITLRLRVQGDTPGTGGTSTTPSFANEGRSSGTGVTGGINFTSFEQDLKRMSQLMSQAQSMFSPSVRSLPLATNVSFATPTTAASIEGSGTLPVFMQGLPRQEKISAADRRNLQGQVEMLERIPADRFNPSMTDALEHARSRLNQSQATPSFARLQAAGARATLGESAEIETLAAYGPAVGGGSGEALIAGSIRRATTLRERNARFQEGPGAFPDEETIRTSGVTIRGRGQLRETARQEMRQSSQYEAGIARAQKNDPQLESQINDMVRSIVAGGKDVASALEETARRARATDRLGASAEKFDLANEARANRTFDAAAFAQQRIDTRSSEAAQMRHIEREQALQGFGGYGNAQRPEHIDYQGLSAGDNEMDEDQTRRKAAELRGNRPPGRTFGSRAGRAYNFAMNKRLVPTGLYYAAFFGFSQYASASSALENAENIYQQPEENLQNIRQAQKANFTGMGLGSVARFVADANVLGGFAPGNNKSLTKLFTGYGSYKEYEDSMNTADQQDKESKAKELRFQQLQQTRIQAGTSGRDDVPVGMMGQLNRRARMSGMGGDDTGAAIEQINNQLQDDIRGITAMAEAMKNLGAKYNEYTAFTANATTAARAAANQATQWVNQQQAWKNEGKETQIDVNNLTAGGGSTGQIRTLQHDRQIAERLNRARREGGVPGYEREQRLLESEKKVAADEDEKRNEALRQQGLALFYGNQGYDLKAQVIATVQRSGAEYDKSTGFWTFKDLQGSTTAARTQEYNLRMQNLGQEIQGLYKQDAISRSVAMQQLQAHTSVTGLEAEGKEKSAEAESILREAEIKAKELRDRGGPDADKMANEIIRGAVNEEKVLQRRLALMGQLGEGRVVASGTLGPGSRTQDPSREDPKAASVNVVKAIQDLQAALTRD